MCWPLGSVYGPGLSHHIVVFITKKLLCIITENLVSQFLKQETLTGLQ